jgi:hypothetical protein
LSHSRKHHSASHSFRIAIPPTIVTAAMSNLNLINEIKVSRHAQPH